MRKTEIPIQKIPFRCLCGHQLNGVDYMEVETVQCSKYLHFKCDVCGIRTKVEAEPRLISWYDRIKNILAHQTNSKVTA